MPSGKIFITAQTIRPVSCFGEMGVSFVEVSRSKNNKFDVLVEGARTAGTNGHLRLYVDGEIVFGHIATDRRGPPAYQFTLEVDKINSVYPL